MKIGTAVFLGHLRRTHKFATSFPLNTVNYITNHVIQKFKNWSGPAGIANFSEIRGEYSKKSRSKPTGSEVLTCYITQTNFPPWTSYFVKYDSIVDDQWGKSHFNWTVQSTSSIDHNYHILRTGCYPYIKYHCTKRPYQDLTIDDKFFRVIKVINLGLPCLAYGIAAKFLLKGTQAYVENVFTSKGVVTIYFLYKEDKGSMY